MSHKPFDDKLLNPKQRIRRYSFEELTGLVAILKRENEALRQRSGFLEGRVAELEKRLQNGR